MKTRKLFTILLLLISHTAYSQFANGVYIIRHMGHSNEKQTNVKYSVDAPEDSNILFYENNIYLTIGGYRVDIIQYDDKGTDYSKEMAEIKAFSLLDNREKTVFIQNLGKGMYSLWLGRGNGGADIFLFTIPDYKE